MELLTPHYYSASFHDEYHEHLNLEVLLLEPNVFHSPPAQGLPSVSHLGNLNRVHIQNMQLHHLEIVIGLSVTVRKITDETSLMVQL